MADRLTQEERSNLMSKIHSTNTTIEIKVRKYLFSKGFRFRVNDKRYAGRPDIVLPKYKTIIFIHGCFWHGHPNCKVSHVPKSNDGYWSVKLKKNVERDNQHVILLESQGWRVITLWECDIKKDFENTMDRLIEMLHKPM